MSKGFSVYVAGFDDDGQLFKTSSINVGASLSDVSVDVIVAIGEGLLYEANWIQVEHVAYARVDGDSWDCMGSFNKHGDDDSSVAGRLHAMLFKE